MNSIVDCGHIAKLTLFPRWSHSIWITAWEQRKLGDIAPVTMGQSPNGACYTDNPNDAVLVQGNADLKDGWVFPRVWTTEITKTAKAGDLIMSVRAPVGAMGKTAYDVVLGRGVAGIAGNEFLFQALSKKEAEGYWSTVSAGSTFDSINGDELRNTPVNYPRSKPEREAVGSCLSRIDCLITLHQRKCQYRGLYGYLSWEQRKFADEVYFFTGLTYTPSDVVDSPGTLVLRSSNVSGGGIVLDDNVYVNSSTPLSENVKPGDIIVVVRNGSRALIGKHAQVRHEMPNTVIGAFMTGIRSRVPQFINALLSTPAFENEVAMNMGATINQITLGMFGAMSFSFPSVSEQKAIGGLFYQLDSLITLHQ